MAPPRGSAPARSWVAWRAAGIFFGVEKMVLSASKPLPAAGVPTTEGMTHDPTSLVLDFVAKILSALFAALLTRRLSKPAPPALAPAKPRKRQRQRR